MRKVYVRASIELILNIDEGVSIDEVLPELEMTSGDSRVDVEEMTWYEHTIEDSK